MPFIANVPFFLWEGWLLQDLLQFSQLPDNFGINYPSFLGSTASKFPEYTEKNTSSCLKGKAIFNSEVSKNHKYFELVQVSKNVL